MKAWILLAVIFCSALPSALAADEEFKSLLKKTTLLELYSSEGCGSCPPADRWVSDLQKRVGLWKYFVPVVFHVTYWDYLGWTDELARPEFTERQENYVDYWKSHSLHTPCFFVNGKEWNQWQQEKTVPFSAPENAGVLKAVRLSENEFHIRFSPAPLIRFRRFQVSAALLGFGVKSEILEGENRGERLRHDFVVLDFQTMPMTSQDGYFSANAKMNKPSKWPAEKYAVAFWVTGENDPRPIQAAGGYLQSS